MRLARISLPSLRQPPPHALQKTHALPEHSVVRALRLPLGFQTNNLQAFRAAAIVVNPCLSSEPACTGPHLAHSKRWHSAKSLNRGLEGAAGDAVDVPEGCAILWDVGEATEHKAYKFLFAGSER
jgi:hypothetical protein